MDKLEKIKKWAEENGYIFEKHYIYEDIKISLYKIYRIKETWIATQYIVVDKETYNIRSRITLPAWYYDERQELEALFIPLNNVKRDEKLLKEYLENER